MSPAGAPWRRRREAPKTKISSPAHQVRYGAAVLSRCPHQVRYGAAVLSGCPHQVRYGAAVLSRCPHQVRYGAAVLSRCPHQVLIGAPPPAGGGDTHLALGGFGLGGGGGLGGCSATDPPPTGRSRPPRWGPGGGLPGQHPSHWSAYPPVGVPAESRGPCGARGHGRGGGPLPSYGGGPGDAGPAAASDTNPLARTVSTHNPGLPTDGTRSSPCCTRCPFPCLQACAPHTTGWPLVSVPLSGPAWPPPLGLKPPREKQAPLVRSQTCAFRSGGPLQAPPPGALGSTGRVWVVFSRRPGDHYARLGAGAPRFHERRAPPPSPTRCGSGWRSPPGAPSGRPWLDRARVGGVLSEAR